MCLSGRAAKWWWRSWIPKTFSSSGGHYYGLAVNVLWFSMVNVIKHIDCIYIVEQMGTLLAAFCCSRAASQVRSCMTCGNHYSDSGSRVLWHASLRIHGMKDENYEKTMLFGLGF
ncbi:unnamed protein product [Musa textilis]